VVVVLDTVVVVVLLTVVVVVLVMLVVVLEVVVVEMLVVVLETEVVVEDTVVVVVLLTVVVVVLDLLVVVLEMVVVVVLAVVVVVVSTQVLHITGHFVPTKSGKIAHMPAKTLQSNGSKILLHLPKVVVVVAVVVVTVEVEHDPHNTGHVSRNAPDSNSPVHRSLETLPQSASSGSLLHKPVVDVVEVTVVGTHESHLNGQLTLTVGSRSQRSAGMPAQSKGSLMIPLQLGVVVVLVLLVVETVTVVTEVVVGQLLHNAGHRVCASWLKGSPGSQFDWVIDEPHPANWSRTPLQDGAWVVKIQELHKRGQAPRAVIPKNPGSAQSVALNTAHEGSSRAPLQFSVDVVVVMVAVVVVVVAEVVVEEAVVVVDVVDVLVEWMHALHASLQFLATD